MERSFENVGCFNLLYENQDKIDWNNICINYNPRVIKEIVANNLDKNLDWSKLSENNTDEAIELLINNKEKIDWRMLSTNNNDKAIELLIANENKIDWKMFSTNNNDRTVELLIINENKIDWYFISINPNIKLFELFNNNKNKINWSNLEKFNLNKKLVDLLINNN